MLKSRTVVVVIVAMVWLSACVVKFDVRTTVAVVTGIPSIGAPSLLNPTPSPVTPAPPPTSTHTPTQTAAATLTSTPDPLSPYFVESLRARSYTGGTIEIVETLEQTSAYTSYLIAYPSDGLRITGMMNVPVGEGPFPVIVLNHGHYDLSEYTTGRGTNSAADIFARHGYLTLAPDYRGHAGSDSGDNFFRTGYVVDVLNLIASVKSLPQAKPDSIGIWGHSMGGGVAIEVMVVNPPGLRGVVLYGAMSGDMTDNYYRIAFFRGQDTPGPDFPVLPEAAPEAYAQLSPINYLQYVGVPVIIHHGDLDDQVPPDWSLRLQDALKVAGKESTLYTYPNAGHSFFDEDWNTFMGRNVEFFEGVVK